MKLNYVEPKEYMSKEMKKILNAGSKKSSTKKSTTKPKTKKK